MTKKILSMALAIAMVMALSVSVFAAGTNTITVTNAKAGETYNAYKMLDLSINADKTAFTYTIDADWAAFFAADGAGYQYVTINSKGEVTAISDAAALAQAAAEYATTVDSTVTPDEDGEAVITGLENGYYLVTSTNGTIAMTDTTPTNPNAEIQEKNPDHTVTKDVQEDDNGNWVDVSTAQIGDTVEYKSTVTILKGAKNVVLHDEMDAVLELNAESIAIEGLTKGTDYTVNAEASAFEITFAQTYLNTIATSVTLTVTYEAVLNENADPETDYVNKTWLTWGNADTSAVDSVKTNTFKFEVYKHAAGATENLADAVFQLMKGDKVVKLVKESDTVYRVAMADEANAVETFKTVASGNIVITGVDTDADYTLVETEAPAGYNMLSAPVEVGAINDNSVVVDVENKTGTELPSTGGIGTTIFYALGAVMVIGAGVLLVAKKRMSVEG